MPSWPATCAHLVRSRIAAGEKPGADPRLAGRALRQLGQLPAAGRAGDLAACGRRRSCCSPLGAWLVRERGSSGGAHDRLARPRCCWSRVDAWRACGCSGCAGAMLQLAAAALAVRRGGLCAAGPARPRRIARAARSARTPPLPLTGARHALFGQFNAAEHWLIIAEGYAARGNTAGRGRAAPVGGARASRRSCAVGRARQCAGRPCRSADPGRASSPIARAAELRPTIPRRASSSGWRWPDRATATARSPMWRAILADAPADAELAAAGRGGDRRARAAAALGRGSNGRSSASATAWWRILPPDTLRPVGEMRIPPSSLPRRPDWRSSARTAGSHC